MRYGSICSGIEAATVAWHGLGWAPQWFSEIAPFPCRVLSERWPRIPNLGDFTKIHEPSSIDLLVGGTPCQSFSVAGLRGGLDDDRGNLALEFCLLAQRTRPRWVLWENVPGVLSSGGGRDFGSILGALALLGYGFAYRVLDAQFFGVPQRRRRVFLVGHLGDWRPAAAVLFEPEGLRGDSAPSRGTWTGPARDAQDSVGECGQGVTPIQAAARVRVRRQNGMGVGHEGDPMFTLDTRSDHAIAFDPTQVTHPENRSRPEPGDPSPTLAKGALPPAIAFHHQQDPISGDVSPALTRDARGMGVCVTGEVTHTLREEGFDASEDGTGRGTPLTVASCLTHHHGRNSAEDTFVPEGYRVRRLTPRECERLQGFPDDYTAISGASDSARYAALGNSMAVPVMRWIGERIDAVARSARQEAA